MYIDIPILDTNDQPHTTLPHYESGGEVHLMKRTIDVGPAVSATIALVYLGVWVAGVFLCCCCLGRSRKMRTLFVWKGHRTRLDNLKDRPRSEGSIEPPGIHGEIPKKVSMPVEHDPWAGAIARLHQKPPKSKGKDKGKNKSSGSDHDHDHHHHHHHFYHHHIAPAPEDPQISLFPINEESMSNRMSTGGSKAMPHDSTDDRDKSTRPTNTPRAAMQLDSINPSEMSHLADGNSHSQNHIPAFSSFSRHNIYDTYGTPVHQLAHAASSGRSLRLDSPPTADSDISRQLQTPCLDAFPLPARLSTNNLQRQDDIFTTNPLSHGNITPTADSMSDTR